MPYLHTYYLPAHPLSNYTSATYASRRMRTYAHPMSNYIPTTYPHILCLTTPSPDSSSSASALLFFFVCHARFVFRARSSSLVSLSFVSPPPLPLVSLAPAVARVSCLLLPLSARLSASLLLSLRLFLSTLSSCRG